MDAVEFSKGHGTENDFVVLPDPEAALELTASKVAALCDRRAGIGADGVLRVAKAGKLLDAGVLDALPAGVAADDWFMDYRNADGSIAEMCGNGVRVFAHYLAAAGWEPRAEYVVGSRAGGKQVTVHSGDPVHGEVTVAMGRVRELGPSTASLAGWAYPGIGIDVGNPHLACVAADLSGDDLAKLDLTVPPGYDPDLFPQGVNIEFVTPLPAGPDPAVDMRVYERGVGETRSCGTGTVAAAAAALHREGFRIAEDSGEVRVRVPGGAVSVRLADGQAWLRGPSVLLAHGRLAGEWWLAH